jgi:hypothetical protein
MTTSYRRFMPPPVATGGAAAASGFSTIMVNYLHDKEHRRQQATWDACEDEGGRVTEITVAAAPIIGHGSDGTVSEPLPIGLVAGAPYCRCRDAILAS